MYSRAFAKRTLTPEKKRKVDHAGMRSSYGSISAAKAPSSASGARNTMIPAGKAPVAARQYHKPAPSNILSKLSTLSSGPTKHEQATSIQRSHSLLTRPNPEPSPAPCPEVDPAPRISPQPASDIVPNRDDRLAIVEQLEVGPVDHKPPLDDPHFERLEPNSGIRLS